MAKKVKRTKTKHKNISAFTHNFGCKSQQGNATKASKTMLSILCENTLGFNTCKK